MPLVPAEQFPFCGPTYLAVSPIIDCQRSINLYPEPGTRGSKTQMGLTGRPGYSIFSTALSGGGHYLWAGNGRLFAASGINGYEVSNAGAIIKTYAGALNSSSGVQMPIIANGTQLLICDPLSGVLSNFNAAGSTLDPVFNGVALEYLDGFYLSIATGASLAGTNPNQINASTNGDGTSWPGLSFVIRTGAADLTIQLAVLNSLLYIFGQKTIEVWYDAGNNVFPLARVANGQINIGCLAAQSVVKFSNTVLWLGSDQTGYGQVYMMQGMNPVKVSNPAIEGIISAFGVASGPAFLTLSRAFGYHEAGHIFYVLNLIPTGLLTSKTLVYDLTTGLWHERSYSAGIRPAAFASVPNFTSTAGSGANFVINESNGKIYYQGINYPSDDGSNITYTRFAPHTGGQNQWVNYSRFTLDMDPQADGSAGTIAPILDYSNNGGKSYLGFNYPMAQLYDTDGQGGFQRFFAMQLGRSRDRSFSVTITDNTNLIRIANAYLNARILPGSESQ